MARYVVDTTVVQHLLAEGLELPTSHQLLAPTLLRSQLLDQLYGAARAGELTREEALARHARFSTMKLRYLGDKVLRRKAWGVAEQLGWASTADAEYVALTQLQADALVTRDAALARAAATLVEVATLDALL